MTDAILTSGVAWTACRYHCRRFRPRTTLRIVFIAFSVLLTGTVAPVRAQTQTGTVVATERGVKAAFLYKFLGYIEWPPKAFPQRDNPISIGVIGADDIAEELQQITPGRRVDNRAIVVRRMREGDSVGGLNMLFIGRAASARIPVLAHMAQQRSIVVVTDSPGALEQGSVINFLSAEGRVRFEISVESADRSGVKLSSRLLAVAEVVRTGS